MVSTDYLINCKKKDTGIKDLVDISLFKPTGSVQERLAGFIKTAKNPYCFRVKNTPVKVVFSDKASAPEIETALVNIATRRLS
ncbi:MAG: hypothetical protein K2I29_04510 [Clostridia bacterium]|nr:hypothetical protein [Clostridia bacterium]